MRRRTLVLCRLQWVQIEGRVRCSGDAAGDDAARVGGDDEVHIDEARPSSRSVKYESTACSARAHGTGGSHGPGGKAPPCR